jgi:hypothetical protein
MDHPTSMPLGARASTRRWIAAITLSFSAGAGSMLVAFPYLFPPPVAADAAPVPLATIAPAPVSVSPSTQTGRTTEVSAATAPEFRFDENAPGRDPIHWANGTGSFVLTAEGWVLRLNGDFRAGPGPNFWIYLNTTAVGEENAFRADHRRIKLAPLRAFAGAQNYQLPAGLNPNDFHTLTIWCETFGVYIASGALGKPPQG